MDGQWDEKHSSDARFTESTQYPPLPSAKKKNEVARYHRRLVTLGMNQAYVWAEAGLSPEGVLRRLLTGYQPKKDAAAR